MTKAVFAAAGFGTRFFPLTKVLSKAMLPILNRPIVDHLVDEVVLAGASEVIFVVLPGDEQIRGYFDSDHWLRNHLTERGWASKYAPIAELHAKLRDVRFTFVEQPLDGRYGTAIPPLLVRELVGDDDWFLLATDDLIVRRDGGSDLADMLARRQETGAAAAMAAVTVPDDRVSRYGVLRTRTAGGAQLLEDAIEKPALADAPSRLVSISRFLLGADFFDHLAALAPDPVSGEYLSITALVQYAQSHDVLVHEVAGEYFDCGNPEGWLAANVAVASQAGG